LIDDLWPEPNVLMFLILIFKFVWEPGLERLNVYYVNQIIILLCKPHKSSFHHLFYDNATQTPSLMLSFLILTCLVLSQIKWHPRKQEKCIGY